jgi:hypothetical protein
LAASLFRPIGGDIVCQTAPRTEVLKVIISVCLHLDSEPFGYNQCDFKNVDGIQAQFITIQLALRRNFKIERRKDERGSPRLSACASGGAGGFLIHDLSTAPEDFGFGFAASMGAFWLMRHMQKREFQGKA